MKLAKEETDLFFKLMWGLQFYVNQKRKILTDVASAQEFASLSMTDKVTVRDTLWENPDLIDAYVEENPDGLSSEQNIIVSKWKQFIAGTFQVFRYLKKHTIFIGAKSQVYGVLALYDSFEDIFYGQPLPVMVQAVLLPFKGKIIYDGVLKGYNVTFGGGIRSGLKEEYMAAKQNERIITTLEPETSPTPIQHKKPAKDWRPAVAEVLKLTKSMRGGPAIQSAAFGLLRASANLAQVAVEQPENLDELWRLEQQTRRALSRLQTVLERAEM